MCEHCKYWDRNLNEYPCNQCEHNYVSKFKAKTNIDIIRGMNEIELARFLIKIYNHNERDSIYLNNQWVKINNVLAWLTSEAQYEKT